jgi:hypothetical protein
MIVPAMTRREHVIELSTRITTLRAEISRLEGLRRELTKAQAELDELIGVSAEEGDPASLNRRIVALLEQAPAQEFEAEDVARELGVEQSALPTVRSALARLKKDHRINKAARGKYRARRPEEQANKIRSILEPSPERIERVG